jgi:hypothetical protein
MKRVFFATLLLTATACGGAAAAAPTLRDAEEFYFQSQVADAETAFNTIRRDTAASPADRAAADRDLARIQWLIDRDAPAALASLSEARETGADLCATTVMAVRVLDESGAPRQAALDGRTHAADCPGQAQSAQLLSAAAKAWLDAAASASGARRASAVAGAGKALRELSPLAEASPVIQNLKLCWAIEAGRAPAALEAWKSFFWLTDHNAPAAFGLADAEVARRFRGGLASHAAAKDEVALLSLLIRGGFYEEARRFDTAHGLARRAAGDAAYAQVAAYYALRDKLDPAILAFNRATARGHRDDKAFQATLTRIIFEAAHKLDPSVSDPRVPLQKAFGLYGTVGETGGFASLHAGHVVQDDTLKIEQFGRRGEVRFMLIENMVSNGYQSWLWDGMAQAGGWSGDKGTIVQVRPAYTPVGLRALASTEPEIAARLAARQPGLERQDRVALAKTPVAYLPGLAARLSKQADAQVAAKARAEADRSGQPYPRVYVKFYWDAVVGHSITAHEGRHSLDNLQFANPNLPGAELEYRAKLSELMLAEFPRMPLSNIQTSEIGGSSPHGLANTRVFEGYLRWMDAHRGEIAGFDPGVPTLEQLDRLTDAQVRAVARTLDPQFASAAAAGR